METSIKWIPEIGMEFDSADDVWKFWLEYGGRMGFNVRKAYRNMNSSGMVSSRRFVCAKEGHRDSKETLGKRCRAETRTDCKARIGCVLIPETNKYQIHDFVPEHNHPLHLPETIHMLTSQRKISKAQEMEIDFADDFGIKPSEAHEFIGAHVGGSANLGYTHQDHRNYLQKKRQRSLLYGEAGSLLRYFHMQTVENPSFQYSVQLDCEEQVTNVFWADAKMLIDYAIFGDVVVFDTTFGTNKENRPIGVFVGFNHFRELVIFGATLLYDETAESFKWLFETFLTTHDNKHPRTIFTDQDMDMGKAIGEVMSSTSHGLCTWHIMQNALKHLNHDGSNVLQDFKACMYEYNEVDEFEEAFDALRGKVTKGNWLESIYALKEKWAECFMKDVLSLGMRSTQLSESFNRDLKDCLHAKMDIIRFFKHFDRLVRKKRQNELASEFGSREKLPRMKMRRTPLLKQAGEVYTPKMFEAFQEEYDWSTAAYIKPSTEGQASNEYVVAISNIDDSNLVDMEHTVFGDPLTQTVTCSCKLFERLGILCSHAIKVLDSMNIKLIPQEYILKRWTKEARSGIVREISGRVVVEDPQLNVTRRYRSLCRKLVSLASRAANFEESSLFLENRLHTMVDEVDKMLSSMKITEHTDAVPDLNKSVQLEDSSIPCNVVLKKKKGKTNSRRLKSWTDKLHTRKRKKVIVHSLEDQPRAKNKSKNKKNQIHVNEENPLKQVARNENHEVMPSFHSLEATHLLTQGINMELTQFNPVLSEDISSITLGL